MDINEGIAQLTEMFKSRDWFHSVGVEKYGRLVVYTKYMCHETLHDIPGNMGKIQVLVHFASSLTATREQYTGSAQSTVASFQQAVKEAQSKGLDTGFVGAMEPQDLEAMEKDLIEEEEDKSLVYLQSELNRLEKQCGSNTLEDIFYEIKDGNNAVTNLSGRYPEVRKDMEKLFDDYGFDVIYEEI